MPEYLAPGVYVEEVSSGSKPIEGASTSTAGMVGMTARGPINTPTLVTSPGAFARVFGGRLHPDLFTNGLDALPYAAEGFFTNGGSRLFVVRVVGDEAVESQLDLVALVDGESTERTFAATAAAGDSDFEVSVATGLADDDLLLLTDGVRTETVTIASLAGTTVTIAEPLRFSHGTSVTVQRVTSVLRVHALSPGVWGDSLRVYTREAAQLQTHLSSAGSLPADNAMLIRLETAFGLFPGSVLQVGPQLDSNDAVTVPAVTVVVASVNPSSGEVALTGELGAIFTEAVPVTSQEFSLIVERIDDDKAVESETFEKLSLASTHPRYALTQVGAWNTSTHTPSISGGSSLIRLSLPSVPAAGTALIHELPRYLTGGDDDIAGVDDNSFIGNASDDPDARTGIQALENEPALSIVAVPGQTSVTVQKALVAHCERMRYRFAALDTPQASTLAQARSHRQNFDTTRAAVYYPGLVIADPFAAAGELKVIPPSGHMLGVMARTDNTRGVHKAPANEVVRGILQFETRLGKGEQDILNPLHVNCFRDFRNENRGLRIYGARVATSDPEYKYVNVRRLLLFIEQSLDTGLQWAVFEPNDTPLWNSVRQSVGNFLTTVWRSGALAGTTQAEAFFVNIGYNVTMTQDDIDNGRMIVEIGVAPVKPAEFVIVRVSQKTREATA